MALLKYNNNSLFSDLVYFLVLDGFLFFFRWFSKTRPEVPQAGSIARMLRECLCSL